LLIAPKPLVGCQVETAGTACNTCLFYATRN
jgi:hypothetical protein